MVSPETFVVVGALDFAKGVAIKSVPELAAPEVPHGVLAA